MRYIARRLRGPNLSAPAVLCKLNKHRSLLESLHEPNKTCFAESIGPRTIEVLRTTNKTLKTTAVSGPTSLAQQVLLGLRKVLLAVLTLVLCLCGSGRTAGAAPPGRFRLPDHGQKAIDAIPLEQLSDEARKKVSSVVSQPSLYRRLPVTVIQSDPEMYLFLVRHPEVVVNMWDLMGITKVKVERTGDYAFDATDSLGTTCQVELLYGDRNTHVMYAEGRYDGPLLPPLAHGTCVLVLQTEYAETSDRSVHITSRLDMFLQFDNVGAELLAKTLHPLVGKAADHNFAESTRFLEQVSAAAQRKAIAMQHLADKLTNIQPEVQQQFAELAAEVNHRAALRDAAGFTPEASVRDSAETPVSKEEPVPQDKRVSQDKRAAENPSVAIPLKRPKPPQLRR